MTPKTRHPFREIILKLLDFYGARAAPAVVDPFGIVLWENILYLADDERREMAFMRLVDEVGASPEAILAASSETLASITSTGGILNRSCVEKLKRAAEIAFNEFDSDLNGALRLSPSEAKRKLMKFPGIGDPGAEKILLFSKTFPILALDSNGLRVLLRLGFGVETNDYRASYRSAQSDAAPELPDNCDMLIQAHQLLRLHGQKTCKRNRPLCGDCPLSARCRFFYDNRANLSRFK